MKAYFHNAKVGDKVESLVYGLGYISCIDRSNSPYPLLVHYSDGGFDHYTTDGKYTTDHIAKQVLFYPGVQVIPPKRFVTVTTQRFGNIYDNGDVALDVNMHDGIKHTIIRRGQITLSYEIEE